MWRIVHYLWSDMQPVYNYSRITCRISGLSSNLNFFLYLAVLPIIVITCRKAGSFLVGVIIAFVYGYGGMFAAGNMTLANIYPITASLGMVGYRNYDTAVHWNIVACMCSLVFVVIISAVFILCMKETEPQKAKKKAKKVITKKGW